MAKRLLCPNCRMKNSVFLTHCYSCNVNMTHELRKNPFGEFEVIDIGRGSLEKAAVISLMSTITLFLITFTSTSQLKSVATMLFMSTLLLYFWIYQENKQAKKRQTLRPRLSLEKAKELYEFYLSLGPENGIKACAETRCHQHTLAHCNYCKTHWFAKLKGEQGIMLLEAYQEYLSHSV